MSQFVWPELNFWKVCFLVVVLWFIYFAPRWWLYAYAPDGVLGGTRGGAFTSRRTFYAACWQDFWKNWKTAVALMTAASGIAVFIARMCLPTEPQEAPCRVVTFLIERHWDPSIDPTSVLDCTSGGFDHFQKFVSPFLRIASVLAQKRRTIMFRPRHVLERAHGNIPESTRWLDWFDWDVDSFEFQTPADMHRAFKADPSRFEFVDIYSDARTALNKMMASTAEVLVIHMYGKPGSACYDTRPMELLERPLRFVAERHMRSVATPSFAPSFSMSCAAQRIVDRLGGEGAFASVHARRGDVLTVSGMKYHDFTGAELAEATSPRTIAGAIISLLRKDESVVLFSNEKNRSVFDPVKQQFPERLHLFTDLISELPPRERIFFENGYNAYFLARQVAAKNRFHICTVESKLGAGECNARLVDLLPNTDRREGRLRTLLKWAPLLW